MHYFYFVVEHDPRDVKRQGKRVNRICEVARTVGARCHVETHADTYTVQVEVFNDIDACAFKISVEPAIHCGADTCS